MENNKYQTIESHFSLGQNTINFLVFRTLSDRSLTARDRPTLNNLRLYHNSLMELFENFRSVLDKDSIDDFYEKSMLFDSLMYAMMDGKLAPTLRNVDRMLFILSNMRYILTTFLQRNFKYFYRMTTRQPKGLNNLDHLIENNIFK